MKDKQTILLFLTTDNIIPLAITFNPLLLLFNHQDMKMAPQKRFVFVKKILRSIGFPFRYYIENYNRINLVILPTYILGLLGFVVVIHELLNKKNDTTNITNFGFAILVGMASVCFSWIRALSQDEPDSVAHSIRKAGEMFLHSAIIFILASSLKYTSFHLDFLIPSGLTVVINIFKYTLLIVYSICFGTGFYKAFEGLIIVNLVLYQKLHGNEKR